MTFHWPRFYSEVNFFTPPRRIKAGLASLVRPWGQARVGSGVESSSQPGTALRRMPSRDQRPLTLRAGVGERAVSLPVPATRSKLPLAPSPTRGTGARPFRSSSFAAGSIRLATGPPASAARHCGRIFTRSPSPRSAVEAANRAIRSYPNYPNAYRWLAAAVGQLGHIEEAKRALERAIAIAPAAFDMYVRERVPWQRPEDHAHMIEGLRKAGMPEE
jgi:tetratricopeptide (TPR) repeat protein